MKIEKLHKIKLDRILVIFMLLIMLPTTACNNGLPVERPWKSKVDIPNADFIFSTIIQDNENDYSKREILGFYSFEDKNTTYLDLGDQFPLVTPFYLDANTIISARKVQNVGLTNLSQAYLTIFNKDSYKECENYMGDIFPYKGNILIADSYGYFLVDPSDCSIIKTIISGDDLLAIGDDFDIGASAYSEQGEYILLNIGSDLVQYSLTTKKIKDYDRVGIIPVLSPDQQKVAYLSYAGIHIMDISGENDFLAVPYIVSTYEGFIMYDKGNPPIPFWASDGNELIYHKCTLPGDAPCHNIADYGIFIYNLSTNTETLILKGGLYPSWNYYKKEEG